MFAGREDASAVKGKGRGTGEPNVAKVVARFSRKRVVTERVNNMRQENINPGVGTERK